MTRYLLVCGSRKWEERTPIERELGQLVSDVAIGGEDDVRVLHGGARGADKLAGAVAEAMGLRVKVMEADWRQHDPAWCRCSRQQMAERGYCAMAGHKRNRAMLDLLLARRADGALVSVMAFVAAAKLGDSPGTHNMVSSAHAKAVPVQIVFPWRTETMA